MPSLRSGRQNSRKMTPRFARALTCKARYCFETFASVSSSSMQGCNVSREKWGDVSVSAIKDHGTNYQSNLFREDSFVPMKGAKALPPAGTNMMRNNGPERRPESGMSSISIHVKTPEPHNPHKTNQWQGYMFNRPQPVGLPPSYLESEAVYVDPFDKKGNKQLLRSPSPSPSAASSSKRSGRVTPYDDRDSPVAPVGHDLYNTDYVMTPVPRSTTPHLPAPSPKPGQRRK